MFPVAIALFLKSMILGVGVSAPLGPNGMLMVNRTIRKGFRSGFFSGMGLATADTIFAIIAGLGFSFIIGFINAQVFYIKLFTGIVVALMGLKLYLSNPVREIRLKSKEHTTHLQDYASLLLLALTNPFSIFIFLAFFTGFNIDFSQPGILRVVIILGIFIGACAWWLGVSYVVNHFSRKLRLRSIVKLNKISGTIIALLGIAVLVALLVSVLA
jgi:threonine/homoserine/homoserine lactone efflux protein